MLVELLPGTLPDLLESAEWYELERVGLGADLLVEVDRAIDRIAEGPLRFPAVRGKVRRAQVDRYPFGVYFLLRPDRAVIFTVTHLSRDPAVWQNRIPRK